MEKLRVNVKEAQDLFRERGKCDRRLQRSARIHALACRRVKRMKVDSNVQYVCVLLRGLIEHVFPVAGDGWQTHTLVFAFKHWTSPDYDAVQEVVEEYGVTLRREEMAPEKLPNASAYTWMVGKYGVSRFAGGAVPTEFIPSDVTTVRVFHIALKKCEEPSSD